MWELSSKASYLVNVQCDTHRQICGRGWNSRGLCDRQGFPVLPETEGVHSREA